MNNSNDNRVIIRENYCILSTVISIALLSYLVLSTGCARNETGPGEDTNTQILEVVSNTDDSNIPQSLRDYYWEDAARLAVRSILNTGGSQSQEIEIPVDSIRTFYNSLIRIYNATVLAARDSVIETYKIHTYFNPPLYPITLSVDTTMTWVHAWRDGNVFTGNAEIDTLLARYDLELDSYNQYMSQTLVILKAIRPLNLIPLAHQFETVPGVVNAHPDYGWGDGFDIITSDTSVQWIQLDYTIGWGAAGLYIIGEACPNGCPNRRYWRFRIFEDNRVQFINSWGSPAPAVLEPGI
ncbi:hypothetical protein ACFL6R_03765 [Gemmatimonadota bacterium]